MSTSRERFSWIAWLVGPGFVGVAAWLLLASPPADIPRGEIRLAPRDQLTPGPWRQPLLDARKASIGGQIRPCSECHRLYAPASDDPNRVWVQHLDIEIHHGMNARCLNCHDGADRNKLVLHNGTLVEFADAAQLCSNCHGTVYRDWQRGMHGKTVGSWDATSSDHQRLRCTECHDPHAPAYAPMPPLHGPITFRMGDPPRPAHDHAPHAKVSPLRRWSQSPQPDAHAPHDDAHTQTPDQPPDQPPDQLPDQPPAKEHTP